MLHKKENVTLLKGFKKNKDGTLSCKDYNFGQESELVGKTFKLGNDKPLELCKNGFHACDGIGKTYEFYNSENSSFYKIKVSEAFYEDAEKYVFRNFEVIEEVTQATATVKNRNTGNSNTGDWNTGDRNLCDNSSGFFCMEEPKAICFDSPTKLKVSEFRKKFNKVIENEPTFESLMKLPNATENVVNKYLKKYNKLKNRIIVND